MKINRCVSLNGKLFIRLFPGIVFTFILFFTTAAHSQPPLILSDTNDKYFIGKNMSILEDPEGELTLKQVMSKSYADRFEKCTVDIKNLGYTLSAYWLKFTIRNDTTKSFWILDFDYPLIDDIKIFDPVYFGYELFKQGGRYLPFGMKDDEYRNFSFHLQLSPGSERVYYIRVQSEDSLPLPVSIVSPTCFYNKNSLYNFAYGMFFGSLLIMIFYNLFIFASTKDINSLYFILLITVLHLMFHLVLSGYASQFIGRNSIWWSRQLIAVFEVTGVLIAIVFTKSFLNTKKETPVLNQLLNVNGIALFILLCLIPFIQYFFAIVSAVLITMCAAMLMWVSGFVSMLRGNKSARFYVLGWTALEMFGMIYGLKTLALLPSNIVTEYIFTLGAALHGLFFLIAIADAFNQLVQKREIAQQKMLSSEKRYRMIANNIRDVIFVLDFKTLAFTYVSPSVELLLGYNQTEFISISFEAVVKDHGIKNALSVLNEEMQNETFREPHKKRGPRIIEYLVTHKKGHELIIETVNNFMRDEHNTPVAIVGSARDITARKKAENEIQKINSELEQRVIERTETLNLTLKQIESVNLQMVSSLKYARLIQLAMLPGKELVQDFFSKMLVLWKPRDIVGGDFYYIDKIAGGYIVAVGDCTGHGVPGAFLTILSTSELKKTVRGDKCYDPAAILNRVNREIKIALKQDTDHALADDGLDLSICVVYPHQKEIIFAGARLPLMIVKDHNIETIKGDKQSLGYISQKNSDYTFTNHKCTITPDMFFYLYSDGYPDQPNTRMKRFGTKRLRETVLKASRLPFEEQYEYFENVHDTFRGNRSRVDDMTLIGFRIPGQHESL